MFGVGGLHVDGQIAVGIVDELAVGVAAEGDVGLRGVAVEVGSDTM